jgi:hypothetical protein
MATKFPFGPHRKPDRSFAEILSERCGAPPKDPAEAASSFIHALARALLDRETRPERKVQILRDFDQASRDLVSAAATGATVEEQAAILHKHWEHLSLPEPDFRKRRETRGPSNAKLQSEVKALKRKLDPILRRRQQSNQNAMVAKLRRLASWATPKKLREAADSPPMAAACILIGTRYHLSAATVRDRISQARKMA